MRAGLSRHWRAPRQMFCAFLVKQLCFLTIVFPAPWHILFILRCSSHCHPGASGKLLLTASSQGGCFPCRARASVNATLCGFFHVRIEARLSAEFRGMPVEHLVFIAESRYLHGRDLPCREEPPSEAPAQVSIGGQSGDINQKDRSSHECLCHGRCRLGC